MLSVSEKMLTIKNSFFWYVQFNISTCFHVNYYHYYRFSTDPPTVTTITTLPSNTTVLRDAAVSLKCKTDANPDAHIFHFYLNGSLIANSSSGVLNFIVKADGVYTCVPINTVGTGDNDTVSINAVGKQYTTDVFPQNCKSK